VRISGHLSETTLGDVLGTLYRARVTGLVRITERSGAKHGIYLSRGEVIAVDTPARVPRLGEILRQRGLLDGTAQRALGLRIAAVARSRRVGELLVDECRISPDVVGAALRQQLRARLEAVFAVRDAQISFHVVFTKPENPAPPLSAREYLSGRPRARDAGREGPARVAPRIAQGGQRSRALEMLGLDEDASLSDVTRAFREMARELHPDRHLETSEAERRAMEQRFAALSAAYHTLIG